MQSIGEFEYTQSDLIGHGAFALVFRGRRRKVGRAEPSVYRNSTMHAKQTMLGCVRVSGSCFCFNLEPKVGN